MKSRRLNVLEDRQTILGPHARCSNSSEPIPIDLMIDILSRLSPKSIARCRCVSKLWASVLRLPYFTDLFLTKSSAYPKLLFACHKGSELFFFSTPQNPVDESSSPLAATYHMKIPFNGNYKIISSIRGLVFIRDEKILKGRKNSELVSVICNPSTRQSFTLPKPNTRKRIHITSYFGYDPIEKQYKVLSMTQRAGIFKEHQVLTLGTKKPTWRMIECCITHIGCKGICINGILYYPAKVNMFSGVSMIVCFDVRSEKFSFIKIIEPFMGVVHPPTILVNYKGKLASLMSEGHSYISVRHRSFEMWVLEDPEKYVWSKHIYELPPLWQNVLAEESLNFVALTSTNEIVLSPPFPSHPFYVFYYNFERSSIRRVEIQGMGAFKNNHDYIFLDHVEDVKLIQEF